MQLLFEEIDCVHMSVMSEVILFFRGLLLEVMSEARPSYIYSTLDIHIKSFFAFPPFMLLYTI